MKKLIYAILICAICALVYYGVQEPAGRLEKNDADQHAAQTMSEKLAEDYNAAGLKLMVNGSEVSEEEYQPYIGDDLHVMLPVDTVRDKLGCTVDEYANGSLIIRRNEGTVKLILDSQDAVLDGENVKLATMPVKKNEKIYEFI